MAKYKVTFGVQYSTFIEAESEDDAQDRFEHIKIPEAEGITYEPGTMGNPLFIKEVGNLKLVG